MTARKSRVEEEYSQQARVVKEVRKELVNRAFTWTAAMLAIVGDNRQQ